MKSAPCPIMPARPVQSYEDWRAFARTEPALAPPLPSFLEYESYAPPFKKKVDQERRRYQQTFGPIALPSVEPIQKDTIRLVKMNLILPPGVRPGVVLDGIATVGKTTAVTEIGRHIERQLTQNFTIIQTPSGHDYVPVVYVSLGGDATMYDFCFQLASFYGIPLAKSARHVQIAEKVKRQAADCGTAAIIIDDIHFLRVRNRRHEDLNNFLKHLQSSISATFIYAGIDTVGTGLLSEGYQPERSSLAQTGRRFKKYDIVPFDISGPRGKAEFDAVLTFFEKNMLLYKQIPGLLAKDHGAYIFKRTGGYMGPISSLLREAAWEAIAQKAEQFTRKIFDSIMTSYETEKEYALIQRRDRVAAERAA